MIKVVAGTMLLASLCCAVDRDMQRAIAWERHKERAAAIQARKEARHPSVTYSNDSANRSADRDEVEGRRVVDPGPRPRK
jgi:hypothetical protein